MIKKNFVAMISIFSLFLVSFIQPVTAETKTEQIVTEAKKHIGTPYQWGGTTPSGFDCSGLIGYVYKQYGIDLPRTAEQQYSSGKAVSKSDLQKGDLVFFETYKPGPSHSGIYIGNGEFVHASSSKGITISNVNDPYYWESKWLGARRILDDDSTEDKEKAKNVDEVKAEVLEPLPTGKFHDVSEDFWAYSSISNLAKEGVINGYGNSTFRPNQEITRGQAATLLMKALDIPENGSETDFKDVSKEYAHASAIKAVSDAGLITGNSRNEFMPNEPMTRQHMAVVFYRAFELAGIEHKDEFVDVSKDHLYYKQIQALAGSGITTGNVDGEFQPARETTRAHFSVFLEKALHQ